MIISNFEKCIIGILLMMTPTHYYRYAEKKRFKLLVISAAIAFFIIFILAPYVVSWKILVPILFVIGACLYKIYNTELYLFFGLRETENLISLEEKFNTGIFSSTDIHQHKKNLEHRSFNFYAWF